LRIYEVYLRGGIKKRKMKGGWGRSSENLKKNPRCLFLLIEGGFRILRLPGEKAKKKKNKG
jgi:hypothetical protein